MKSVVRVTVKTAATAIRPIFFLSYQAGAEIILTRGMTRFASAGIASRGYILTTVKNALKMPVSENTAICLSNPKGANTRIR